MGLRQKLPYHLLSTFLEPATNHTVNSSLTAYMTACHIPARLHILVTHVICWNISQYIFE